RIPGAVDALVLKLLAKKPEDRFTSARDLLFAVRDLMPEGSALKNLADVSSTAKTIPFAKSHLPRAASHFEVAVELDEATVVDSGGLPAAILASHGLARPALPGVAASGAPEQDDLAEELALDELLDEPADLDAMPDRAGSYGEPASPPMPPPMAPMPPPPMMPM